MPAPSLGEPNVLHTAPQSCHCHVATPAAGGATNTTGEYYDDDVATPAITSPATTADPETAPVVPTGQDTPAAEDNASEVPTTGSDGSANPTTTTGPAPDIEAASGPRDAGAGQQITTGGSTAVGPGSAGPTGGSGGSGSGSNTGAGNTGGSNTGAQPQGGSAAVVQQWPVAVVAAGLVVLQGLLRSAW